MINDIVDMSLMFFVGYWNMIVNKMIRTFSLYKKYCPKALVQSYFQGVMQLVKSSAKLSDQRRNTIWSTPKLFKPLSNTCEMNFSY